MPHPVLYAAALIQAASSPPVGDDVIVTGVSDPYTLDGDALRAGQKVFDRDRAQFAPAGALFFAIEARRGGALAVPPRIWLSDGSAMLPVAVSPEGRLALPAMPAGKWRLVTDASRRQVMIRPRVVSPGSGPLDLRLGDGRLQCRVFWAMAKETAPILAAPIVGVIDMAGACSSGRIGIYRKAGGTIRAAEVRDGARVLPVALSAGGRSYRLPLSDKTLGNEARVRITLE